MALKLLRYGQMSLWHKFWDFLDRLSDQSIIAIFLILMAWYAVRTNATPSIGSDFASARQRFSLEMVRSVPRLSLCPLRLADLLK